MGIVSGRVITTTQNALSTSSEVVVAENLNRIFVEVKNVDASIAVYIGFDTAVTASTGHKVAAGESFRFGQYVGAIWAIAASGTPTVTTIEW